jgi:hypothetical protein
MRILALLPPLIALAACASPESRLRSGLMDAGLSRNQSSCMAERMTDKLSITQLIRLSSLSKVKGQDVRDMSAKEFLHNVRALRDPEIVSVSTRAFLGCAISA